MEFEMERIYLEIVKEFVVRQRQGENRVNIRRRAKNIRCDIFRFNYDYAYNAFWMVLKINNNSSLNQKKKKNMKYVSREYHISNTKQGHVVERGSFKLF